MNALRSLILGLLALFVIAAAIFYGMASERGYTTEQSESPASLDNEPAAASVEDEPSEDNGKAESLSNEKIGWGLGPAADALGRPLDAISAQSRYGALSARFVFPDEEKKLYLTFDLGYENGYTASILDTLASRGVKAVFFATREYVNEAPEIVERIIAEGHTLGNHTVKHPSMPGQSEERQRAEITELHDYVKDNFSYEMRLFRYPMGEFSERSLALVKGLGYESVFWSFAYRDWLTDAQPDPGASLQRLLGSLHPGGIYLLHAVSATNDAIMGDFIDGARAAGYEFELIGGEPASAAPKAAEGII